ncbi:MAG: hypothetical protein KAQ67_11855 [Gammaproteobacteria bacterium]|nr:hypothetical protein [Gammaproteobacteria bacterium]
MQYIKNKLFLILSCVFMAFPVYAAGVSDLGKYDSLKYKSEWLSDYYDKYKIMRSEIIVYQINNPEITLAEVAKKFSKITPDAKLMKEIKLAVSGESIIVTIILKKPDGATFKEDVFTGRCQGTDVSLLMKYCR